MCFLVFYELIQAKCQGWRYAAEFWNCFDIVGFISFFYMYQLTKPTVDMKSGTAKASSAAESEQLIQCLMVFNIMMKMHYFLRAYTKSGLLVNLLTTCVKDIGPFTAYLFLWILAICLLNTILGVESNANRVGLGQGTHSAMFFYVWENSIGNIQDPTMPPTQKSELVLGTIWFVWWVNQFIIVIIMLNFLISVISQSYENVMNSHKIKRYQDIAALNKEVYEFLAAVGLLSLLTSKEQINQNKIVIAMTPTEETAEETDEWVGFVQTMKHFMRKNVVYKI